MLQKVVVVVPLSPYKPISCWRCHTQIESLSPFCPSCQALQEVPNTGVNYFSVFGLADGLVFNETELRNRYYELSKKTHPDRFMNVPPPESLYAPRWSGLINRAYQTLKDEKLRSEYLLELFQIPTQKSNAIPVDLAETYFELQDILMEEGGKERMAEFKESIIKRIDLTDIEWNAIAQDWPHVEDKEPLLKRLQTLLGLQKTLYSMISDIDRKLGDLGGNRWN